MTERRGTVVVTGADGYVGSRVAARLVDQGRRVVMVVRDPDVRPQVTSPLACRGARLHVADISTIGGLDGLDTTEVTEVVHAAAVTRFNVDYATARAVNVEGTRTVLRWADRCSGLDAVALVSTIYASGLRGGPVPEALGDDRAGFANHYERSKWEAEQIAATEFAHLPIQALRLATVIADDAGGTVTQRNAFHTTLRLVYYGLLSLLPGGPATPVHLVSGRYASDAIVALLRDGSARGTYHLTSAPEATLSLSDVLDAAWSRFAEEPDFARRRVLRPLFADADSFAVLARETESFGGSVVAQAMATMSPFARQLYVHKQVMVERARSVLGRHGVEEDDVSALLRNAIDHLVTTRWGRADGRAA